jgi:hypothetical protein
MGQRGPAPEPVALKLLKGERRPSQLGKAPDPVAPPTRPDDLDVSAGKVWDRILAVTDHIGERYVDVFRLYCETTATLNAMRPKGSKEWRELANVHRQLARELCLTPATGAALTKPKAPERKLDKYLAG